MRKALPEGLEEKKISPKALVIKSESFSFGFLSGAFLKHTYILMF